MGHDDPFGLARGTRGEQDVRRIIGRDGPPPPIYLHQVGWAGPIEKGGPGLRPLLRGAGGNHDRPQIGEPRPGRPEHRNIVGAEEIGDGHQGSSPAAGENDGCFGALESGVHGDQDRSRLEQTQQGDDPLGPVRCPYRHPVAGLHAARGEGGTEPTRPFEEVSVGELGSPVVDRRPVAESLGRGRRQFRYGQPGDFTPARHQGPSSASGPVPSGWRIEMPASLASTCDPNYDSGRAACNRGDTFEHQSVAVTTVDAEVYYDPYDFEIDSDPYPIWRRLRDERPLYYNERYDFYALSRFDDVERCFVDWKTYISGRGSVIEIIKSGIQLPAGSIIFEDPPTHDLHRGLLSRVFTPRKVSAIEPKVREFCARSLDPLIGEGGFDFIRDLGAQMPMRTIGMLLGIPEADQEALRDRIDEGLRLTDGSMPDRSNLNPEEIASRGFADYIDWRAQHPSDDLMTDLLNAEFEDENGDRRRLTRGEVLSYVNLLASAGNETTTRLIGWTGKVLADHPEQRRLLARGPEPDP